MHRPIVIAGKNLVAANPFLGTNPRTGGDHAYQSKRHVTSGVGWTQCEGQEIVEIHAGDVIWCPPRHRHWDGATPDHAMTYIAIHEAQDGKAVEFGEKVTDEEYQKGPSIASWR